MTLEVKLAPEYVVSRFFRRLLVPIDGSENSYKALEIAIDFAQRYGSKVTVLHITTQPNDVEINKVKQEVEKRAGRKGVRVEFKVKTIDIKESSIARAIIREAYEGIYDAILIGARGRSPEEEPNLGSVALSVAINAPCSVIIVK